MSEEQKGWEDYYFFYGGPFSQWAMYPIVVDGVTYNCNEQYMMAQKALLFGDQEMYEKIMASKNPEEQKMKFGRNVKNFDEAVWQQHAKEIVYKANYAKFTQNQKAMEELAYSRGQTVVEASPTDKIWGIGISEGDSRLIDETQWEGTNWLGEVVMQIRSDLEKEGHFKWFDDNKNFRYRELENGGNVMPRAESETNYEWNSDDLMQLLNQYPMDQSPNDPEDPEDPEEAIKPPLS